ncbi:glycosyltransferase family 2 protein [Vibrio splendidus]|uniref:glycosyltransferase family 2 protein n=1 Tax=Vibrio splendidus TaxID=29497 RepID=UPI000769AFDE|nr:glycosyltransferase family 2 protein [Vibrio splendidus]
MNALEDPLVSVIIPVYNAQGYVQEAVESILEQTYTRLEVIVVNDGSTDNSGAILDKMARYDSRLTVYHRKNSGIVKSLNYALSLSKGKYIARMDADDISLPNRIEMQVDKLINGDLILCGTQTFFIGSRSGISELPIQPKHCMIQSFFSTPVYHPTVMFLSSGIEYKEEYQDAEDYMYWVDMQKIGNIGNIVEPLLKYRVHDDQVSRKYNLSQIGSQLKISHKAISDYLGIEVGKGSYLEKIELLLQDSNICRDDEAKKIIERGLYYVMAFFGLKGISLYVNYARKNGFLSFYRTSKFLARSFKWRKFSGNI